MHVATSETGHVPVATLVSTYVGALEGDERIKVVPIDEALRMAKPLPPPGEINIEGLPDDEWDAFMRALTEQRRVGSWTRGRSCCAGTAAWLTVVDASAGAQHRSTRQPWGTP